MNIQYNKPLAQYSSWRVGGVAENYVAPQSTAELREALLWAQAQNWPVTLLGGGTNVLISDQGVAGLTIHLTKLKRLTVDRTSERVEMVAECGVPKSVLLKNFLKYRLSPALFLAGLPGDVGGGVVMNAGIGEDMAPREFVEITDWIEVIPFQSPQETRRYARDQLQWSYRHCRGWESGVIHRVGLSWPDQTHPHILERVKEANRQRLAKQPLDWPSCGSVFKNPEGDKAGRLIEACGLKGFQIGAAQVSERHANFIVNRGGASASEIHQLMEHIQKEVKHQQGLELTTEVVRLGIWSSD